MKIKSNLGGEREGKVGNEIILLGKTCQASSEQLQKGGLSTRVDKFTRVPHDRGWGDLGGGVEKGHGTGIWVVNHRGDVDFSAGIRVR